MPAGDRGEWPPRWNGVTDHAVIDAIARVPRHLFVPPELRDQAYEDQPLPIGLGQTISQPYIVAVMTQALALNRDSRVLEIGTGSGYQAAILAHLSAFVWSIETLGSLAIAAQERLRGLGLEVSVRVGDGRLGWPEFAPYDAIVVTAASRDVPPELALQLAPGGRLVIPLGDTPWDQVLWLIEAGPGGCWCAERLAEVRFVPLVASEPATEPESEEAAALRQILARLLARR